MRENTSDLLKYPWSLVFSLICCGIAPGEAGRRAPAVFMRFSAPLRLPWLSLLHAPARDGKGRLEPRSVGRILDADEDVAVGDFRVVQLALVADEGGHGEGDHRGDDR